MSRAARRARRRQPATLGRQLEEHVRATGDSLTSWRIWSAADWNAGNRYTLDLPAVDDGWCVLAAEVWAGHDSFYALTHPFPLDDCAACAYEHLQPHVDARIAAIRGCEVSELRSNRSGVPPHGVTLGVELARCG